MKFTVNSENKAEKVKLNYNLDPRIPNLSVRWLHEFRPDIADIVIDKMEAETEKRKLLQKWFQLLQAEFFENFPLTRR